MFKNEFHISRLIAGHFRGQLDDKQKKELDIWLRSSPSRQAYFDKLADQNILPAQLEEFNSFDKNTKEEIWSKTLVEMNVLGLQIGLPDKNILVKKLWPRVAVAAAIATVIFGAGLLYISNVSTSTRPTIAYMNDIPAGKTGATLILANGRKIILSATTSGVLAEQSGVRINKNVNGELSYTTSDGQEPLKNSKERITLSTSKGEQYQVKLPDGTQVWLNSASSIQYPLSFAREGRRNVLLNGEAYFEIEKDKKRPFVVRGNGQEIKVLGTHFNVSNYANEKTTTTLIEGSLQINHHIIIKPGEQATGINTAITVVQADTEAAIAWKNGYFKFNGSLESIMNQIARWYNVEVIYHVKPDSTLRFAGKISRSRNISAALKIIAFTEKVHFKIEGRRIIVMP